MNWCVRCGKDLVDGQCAPCADEQKARISKRLQGIRLPATVQATGAVAVKLSRQQLRRLGRKRALSDVTAQLSLSRQARRKAAQRVHKLSWDQRSSELVQKVYRGFTPEPQPLQIDASKIPGECSPEELRQQLAAWDSAVHAL
jgi:hypothetical protein